MCVSPLSAAHHTSGQRRCRPHTTTALPTTACPSHYRCSSHAAVALRTQPLPLAPDPCPACHRPPHTTTALPALPIPFPHRHCPLHIAIAFVPKWHLAGTDLSNAHAARRTQMFPFSPGPSSGGFGLRKNGGGNGFELMGQAGVFPAIVPNGAVVPPTTPLLSHARYMFHTTTALSTTLLLPRRGHCPSPDATGLILRLPSHTTTSHTSHTCFALPSCRRPCQMTISRPTTPLLSLH